MIAIAPTNSICQSSPARRRCRPKDLLTAFHPRSRVTISVPAVPVGITNCCTRPTSSPLLLHTDRCSALYLSTRRPQLPQADCCDFSCLFSYGGPIWQFVWRQSASRAFGKWSRARHRFSLIRGSPLSINTSVFCWTFCP